MRQQFQKDRLIAVILAGGVGSRFGNPEKTLSEVLPGLTLLDIIIEVLQDYASYRIIATSLMHRRVIKWARDRDVDVIVTGCRNYSEDYCMLINALRKRPLLILCGDTIIVPESLDKLLRAKEKLESIDMLSLCWKSGDAVGVDLVYAERCTFGTPIPWRCVYAEHSEMIIDVDTREDLERLRDLFSKILLSCLLF